MFSLSEIEQSHRQVIGVDLGNVQGGFDVGVTLRFPFTPDFAIIETFTYGGDDIPQVARNVYQLWSNFTDDGVLLVFGNVPMTYHPNSIIDMRSRKVNAGIYQFQVQDPPTTGFTGTGDLNETAEGEYMVVINFIKLKKK